jgi:hypothetical protein
MHLKIEHILIAVLVLVALYFFMKKEGFQATIDSFYITINSSLDDIKQNLQKRRASVRDTHLFGSALWYRFLKAIFGRNPDVLNQMIGMYEEMKLNYQMAAEEKSKDYYNELAENAFNKAVRLQRNINMVLRKPLDNLFISYRPL